MEHFMFFFWEQASFLLLLTDYRINNFSFFLRFNLPGGKNGVRFISDLHVTGELTMMMSTRLDPLLARMTMDIRK